MDLDFLDDMEAGQEMPMTEHQREQLYKLIESSALSAEQKSAYHLFIDREMSFNEAEAMKQDLRQVQLDPLSRDIGTLYRSELNIALRKLVNRPNN